MKKSNYKIGVFDSGIGGLNTLKEIKKVLPNESYIYYADAKNNPYGEKTNEELLDITKNIVNKLIKLNIKLIVIACNTATTTCIKELREMYPDVLFVGTEPAIKVACDKNYKNTLLLATPATAKSDRLYELIESNVKYDQKLSIIPCKGLADAIESKDKKRIYAMIYMLIYDYVSYDYDSIVLGSTHYCYIKKELKKLFKNAEIIDGNKGVAKQVKNLLKKNNLLTDRKEKGTTKFIETKKHR